MSGEERSLIRNPQPFQNRKINRGSAKIQRLKGQYIILVRDGLFYMVFPLHLILGDKFP